ncbi:DUF6708 domain-containing protein [Psychrobacter cibarius]|uniref:DUF6708 domain-containing protein n=1 Tax=Psychrobacter cibarius TaxID=282669 RepID=UPI0019182400|nr:DUF6708 domain-containing protein [Psychrobacter cibarius]
MIYNPPNNTHPIEKLLSKPWEGSIPAYREKIPSIEKLSRDVHEVNPDYLLFHPIINSHQLVGFLMAYCFSWLFGQSFFLMTAMVMAVIKDGSIFYYFLAFFIIILNFLMFGFLPYIAYKQFKNKKSYSNKVVLLKQTQQIAYYEHNRKQDPIFHLINYKDIVASVRRNKGVVFEALNLHVIDPNTNQAIQNINLEDMQLSPYDQWTFIRTYMERPADELPLDPRYAHACPTDISTSLLACADIAQEKKNKGLTGLRHEVTIMGWLRACTVSFLDLAEGNIYQSSANPALHPEVQRRLMWDGQNNPYNILPVTAERQAAFANQNQAVKRKWYSGIAINAIWFIGSILYVMLVIA